MLLYIHVKQIGKQRNTVAPVPFIYPIVPKTAGELITETVKLCLASYRCRTAEASEGKVLSQEIMEDMARVGKIAFGLLREGEIPKEQDAIDTAITAFEDGLFRVFLGEDELERPEQEIILTEGADLTFIRLTMLAGRIW